MANRLQGLFEEPEEREEEFLPTWFTVVTRSGRILVDREVAGRLAARIERAVLRPRWLRFADIFGSEFRVRTRDVLGMFESTADQRELERRFDRARRREEREGRVPGEDEDY